MSSRCIVDCRPTNNTRARNYKTLYHLEIKETPLVDRTNKRQRQDSESTEMERRVATVDSRARTVKQRSVNDRGPAAAAALCTSLAAITQRVARSPGFTAAINSC